VAQTDLRWRLIVAAEPHSGVMMSGPGLRSRSV